MLNEEYFAVDITDLKIGTEKDQIIEKTLIYIEKHKADVPEWMLSLKSSNSCEKGFSLPSNESSIKQEGLYACVMAAPIMGKDRDLRFSEYKSLGVEPKKRWFLKMWNHHCWCRSKALELASVIKKATGLKITEFE